MPVHSTPPGVGMFSRFIIRKYDQRGDILTRTAFQSFFTTGQTVFSPDSLITEMDIIKGNRKHAALIRRGSNASMVLNRPEMKDEKSTNVAREYPLMEDVSSVGADILNFRQPGESPYAARAKIDRLREIALNKNFEMIRRTVRGCERLAAQSILTGKQDAIFGTASTDLQYDFLRNPANIITVSPEWDNAGDIMGNINTACDKVNENGEITPDGFLVGTDALDVMIKDTTFKSLSDTRRYELVFVGRDMPVPPEFAKYVQGGFIPFGRLTTTKGYVLWIFTYRGAYQTDAGVRTPYMPVDSALVFASGARCDRFFGPNEMFPPSSTQRAWYMDVFGFDLSQPRIPVNIQNANSVVNPAMFHAYAYQTQDGKIMRFVLQAAPIFPTVQTDGFCTLNGLLV